MLTAAVPPELLDANGQLRQFMAGRGTPPGSKGVAQMLTALIDAGFDAMPHPAGGATLQRWRALSEVATHHL